MGVNIEREIAQIRNQPGGNWLALALTALQSHVNQVVAQAATTSTSSTTQTNSTAIPLAANANSTVFKFQIQVKAATDTFNLNAVLQFASQASGTPVTVQLAARVDSLTGTEFGVGQNSTSSTTPQSATLFGTVTGLAPGAHSIQVVATVNAAATIGGAGSHAVLQTIH